MSDKNKHPGIADGIKGSVLEPIFFLMGPIKQCPRDESELHGGWYAYKYMDYCPICGAELQDIDNGIYQILGLQ